jgi:hypothetical protein
VVQEKAGRSADTHRSQEPDWLSSFDAVCFQRTKTDELKPTKRRNRMRPNILIAAAVLFAAVAPGVASAQGAASKQGAASAPTSYHSSKGYRFDYPNDWKLASQETYQALEEFADKYMHGADVSKMDCVVFHPDTTPLQNVNVVVSDDVLPINQDSVQKMDSELRGQLANTNMTMENLDTRIGHFPGGDAIVAKHITTMTLEGGQSIKLWQAQYAFSGSSHTYIITCSSGVDDSSNAMPKFEGLINSFRIDSEPSESASQMWDHLNPAIKYGLIGAVIGGIYGLLKSLFMSAQKPTGTGGGTGGSAKP